MLFLNGISSLSAKYPVRSQMLSLGISSNLLINLMLFVSFLSKLGAFLSLGLKGYCLQASSDKIRAQPHSDTPAGHQSWSTYWSEWWAWIPLPKAEVRRATSAIFSKGTRKSVLLGAPHSWEWQPVKQSQGLDPEKLDPVRGILRNLFSVSTWPKFTSRS